MKGKLSLEKLGREADKGLRTIGEAVSGKKSAKDKAASFLEDVGTALEGLADSANNKIDSVVDTITLSQLTVKLDKQHESLQGKINARCAILKKQPNSVPPGTLNTWVEQLNSMNDYIKDYPNSIWFFTDQQKIQATNMALKAYEKIDKIIKNPNASIKNYEAAILKIKDQNLRNGIFCIVAGLMVLGGLALLATLDLALLMFSPVIIVAALSVIAGGFLLNQGNNDNNFCNTFQITTPRFFGKQTVLKSAEVSDVIHARQDKITFKM